MSRETTDRDRLREMTEQIPDVPLAAISPLTRSPGMKEWPVDAGHALGLSLLSQREVSVARVLMTDGTDFPRHHHETREWLIVYVGEIEVFLDEDSVPRRIKAGDAIYLEPGTSHRVVSTMDTWLLAISIPLDGGYPA